MLFRDENPILGPLTVIDWTPKVITVAVYYASPTDSIILCGGSSNQDVILPSSGIPVGKMFTIKVTGAGVPVNVTVSNGAAIDLWSGNQLQLLNANTTVQKGSVAQLVWDGSQYWQVN